MGMHSENSRNGPISVVLSEEILAEKTLFQQWKGRLWEACKEGKTKIVKLLLDYGDDTDLNAEDWDRRTSFAWACSNSHEAVAQLLVNHPSFEVNKVDDNGRTNLMWASENGLEQAVKRFLTKLSITDINKKDQVKRTALMYAKTDSIADQLLNLDGIKINSIDQDGMTCLMVASANGLEKTVQRLLLRKTFRMNINAINKKDKNGRTALMHSKTDSIANQLLNVEGIEDDNVDETGKTCLMWASEKGLEQRVKRFLAKLSITDINKKDNTGTTALMYAIAQKNEDVADQLLNLEGIEVDSVDQYDRTCLMWASENNLDQIVVKLLPKLSPESIKKCDNRGWNAFMWACIENSDKVLELMFAKSPMINWDFNAQHSHCCVTGFILACRLKKENAVDLILPNYQRLKIDLKIRDNSGKTGMDYWPEKFKGMTRKSQLYLGLGMSIEDV